FLFFSPRPPRSTLFPYTTLFRSQTSPIQNLFVGKVAKVEMISAEETADMIHLRVSILHALVVNAEAFEQFLVFTSEVFLFHPQLDRKSTRLNSSHLVISYAVFCL